MVRIEKVNLNSCHGLKVKEMYSLTDCVSTVYIYTCNSVYSTGIHGYRPRLASYSYTPFGLIRNRDRCEQLMKEARPAYK